MIELSSSVPPVEGTSRIVAPAATFTAHVVGGMGKGFRFVQNGVPIEPVEITTDPFDQTVEIVAPAGKETRLPAEVLKGQRRETLTSHLFLRTETTSAGSGGSSGASGGASSAGAGGAPTTPVAAPPASATDDGSCAISVVRDRSLYALGLALAAGAFLLLRRRKS